jgi:general nucleoside transport system permease protein
MNEIINFLTAAMVAGTPLVLATLGEIITERGGNLNLGVEGMMYMGAVIGFKVGLVTENPLMALLGAILGGVLGSCIFGFLTVSLRANQIVSGLTLTLFGTGFAGFVGEHMVGQKAPDAIMHFFRKIKIPILGDIPVLGKIFFTQDVLVYAGFVLVACGGFYLFYTRKGLNLRFVGENPAAADSLGINVTLYKYVHIMIGGALCGLAGGYLSLVYVPAWQDSVVAGRGWIAVALVIFSRWNPFLAIWGAVFFGGLDILGFRLQKYNLPVSQYFLDALPYMMTILVLIAGSIKKSANRAAPKGLGTSYFREERS